MVIIIFYLQWHTGVDEETFKYVSIKIAQTTLLKKCQTLAIIHNINFFYSLIWRLGDVVKNLASPDYLETLDFPGELTAMLYS